MISIIFVKLIYILDWIIPKRKNGIVFYSFPDFSDNCFAMYRYLKTNGLDKKYHITWVVSNVERYRTLYPDVIFVRHHSIRSLWEMCRSHYIIRTHSFWANCYIPGRQVMCVAWHYMLIKGYTKSDLGAPHNGFNHFCITSPLFAEMYSKLFNTDLDRFDVVGFPRNDDLLDYCPSLLEEMGLSGFDKIILWMPTYRKRRDGFSEGKTTDSGIPTLNISDISQLNIYLKAKNWCIVIKPHPAALDEIVDIKSENIRILTNDDIPNQYTLYQFIGQTDAMISDYSSVWGDYLLLNRPIGFAFDDLEEYLKTRIIPLNPLESYMPGARIRNFIELVGFLDSLEKEDVFVGERKRVADLFLTYKDSNSTERFLKNIGLL